MPNRKIGSSALAGALSILLVWGVKQWGGVEIPAEPAQAITVVLSFATGYLVAEPS
jgi:hypothetical protein